MQFLSNKRNIIIKLILFFLFIFTLTSCQSSDKTESYFGIDDNISYTCEYNESNNETKIRWKSYIQNNTIFDINKFYVTFSIYDNETNLGEKELKYSIRIKHGEIKYLNCRFFVEGKINKINYEKWDCEYLNVWETYQGWWITIIVIVSLTSLIWIFLVLFYGYELDEIFELIDEYYYILIIIAVIAFPFIIISFVLSWVPILIIFGGIVLFFIVCLICELIKNIYEKLKFCKTNEQKNVCYQISDPIEVNSNELETFNKNNDYSEQIEKENKLKTNGNENIKHEKNKITFKDIAGLEQAKNIFKEKVILPFEHPDLFEKFNKKIGGGILLYGLPGTGKTLFAEAASNEIDALFIPIKCSDIKSKWYGESEKKVKSIFDKARSSNKAIIFFDEFEAIGSKRNDDYLDGNNDLVPEILAEMQGINKKSNSMVLVIAATNRPWAIDSAFLRPGRFDEKIYIPLPDFKARKAMFKIYLNNLPISKDIDYNYLAKITNNYNGADIKEFCEKLKMMAIKESLKSNVEHFISMKDVYCVEKKMKTSVSEEDILKIKEFEKYNS